MKKSFSFLILLSLLCLLPLSGCIQHQTPQVICVLDKEFRIGGNSEYKNVCYTVSNEKDNQRLSVKYSYLQTTDNRTAFFNFSFYENDGMTAKDGGFVWEYYSDNRDASFVITDDLGNTIDFPKGDSYVFKGERTIYISYACAPEAIKNYFLNFSHENCYEYSFYINSVICAPDFDEVA